MASQKVKIIHGTDTKCLMITNGKLKKTVLKDYFGKNGTLIYKIDDEDFLLQSDEDHIFLEPNIEVYFFNECKSLYQLIIVIEVFV